MNGLRVCLEDLRPAVVFSRNRRSASTTKRILSLSLSKSSEGFKNVGLIGDYDDRLQCIWLGRVVKIFSRR